MSFFSLLSTAEIAHVAGHTVLHLIKVSCCIGQIFSLQRRVSLSFNASVYGNLCEYHHKAYVAKKSRFFGLHFCHRQYGSNFNWFDVVGSQTTEFIEVVKAKWPLCCPWTLILVSVETQKPICDVLQNTKSITKKVYIYFCYDFVNDLLVSSPCMIV